MVDCDDWSLVAGAPLLLLACATGLVGGRLLGDAERLLGDVGRSGTGGSRWMRGDVAHLSAAGPGWEEHGSRDNSGWMGAGAGAVATAGSRSQAETWEATAADGADNGAGGRACDD